MDIPYGIPKLDDVQQHLQSDLYRSMLAFDDDFVTRHHDILRRYTLRWGGQPMRLFSRRWEYPFSAQQILTFTANDADAPVTVLDAGSGVTFFPYYIVERRPNARFVCCDSNPAYARPFARLNAARQSKSVEFVCAMLQDLPCDDDTFDAISCISVLEHTNAYPQILDEFRRVLRPGGLLAMTFDISLDARTQIPREGARDLLAAVTERFEPPEGVDYPAMLADLDDTDALLTTDHVRHTNPELLPWKWPILKSIADLLRGDGWTGGFFSLTCFCVSARNPAGE